jgi:hypothetical protein
VGPGAHVAVPYAAIYGYAPGRTEAIVWWWQAVGAAAPAPGAVRSVVLRL